MISRITASVLALALCGMPASALGTASSGSAAAQTDPSFAAGRQSRTPHNNEILVWAGDVWSDVEAVSYTSRDSGNPGYYETDIYVETLRDTTICLSDHSTDAMRLIITLDADVRNRQIHYNNYGERVGRSFYNRDNLNRMNIRISIPILLAVDERGISHTLRSYGVVTGIHDPMKELLEDSVRRAIRRRPPLTVALTETERQAASQNRSEFIRGWATVGSC